MSYCINYDDCMGGVGGVWDEPDEDDYDFFDYFDEPVEELESEQEEDKNKTAIRAGKKLFSELNEGELSAQRDGWVDGKEVRKILGNK